MVDSNLVRRLNKWFYDIYVKEGIWPDGTKRVLSFDAEVTALLGDYHNGLGSASSKQQLLGNKA